MAALGPGWTLVALTAGAAAPVEDDRDGLTGELPRQVVVQRRLLARDDEDRPQAHQLLGGPRRPEAHVHLAQPRQRQAEVLLRLVEHVLPPIQAAEAQVDARGEGTHLEILGECERSS